MHWKTLVSRLSVSCWQVHSVSCGRPLRNWISHHRLWPWSGVTGQEPTGLDVTPDQELNISISSLMLQILSRSGSHTSVFFFFKAVTFEQPGEQQRSHFTNSSHHLHTASPKYISYSAFYPVCTFFWQETCDLWNTTYLHFSECGDGETEAFKQLNQQS